MDAGGRSASRTAGLGIFIAGLIAGITVAAFGVAGAQTAPTTPGRPGTPGIEAAAKAGKRHLGHGIHGEFTAADPDGDGYRRIATQAGEVTAVSTTSITVRSVDGFVRTYVVDAQTKVNGDGTIADIAKGEDVRIAGVIDGDTVRALRIGDGSERMQRRAGRLQRRLDRLEEQGTTTTAPEASGTAA